MDEAGLHCRLLTKAYVGRPVLKAVGLSLLPGKVLGLIGENGAGKSTLNSIVAGVVAPTSGDMTMDGVAYAPTSPSDAMHRGVAFIHQEIRLLAGLTVAENIFLGRYPMAGGRIDRPRMAREAQTVLDALGVDVDPKRTVGGLSMAVQQGIEIAKAITRKPRYIIFDEPTASLGEAEAARIFTQIRLLKTNGVGIVFVSHRLEEIQEISDNVMCLRDGERVATWEGRVSQQEMIGAMVGRDFTFEHHAPRPRGHDVVLRVEHATRGRAFRDISFEVTRGEILGIAGLIGAGRTEVVRAVAGADRLDSGEIHVEGKAVQMTSPNDAIAAGIYMVPEDRKGQGLNLDRTVAKNISLPWERQLLRWGIVGPGTVDRAAERQKRRFDIRGDVRQPVGRMSGGNQQKVLIAKWLVNTPKVFIVDEPTRGVDVGAKMAIYEIIRSLAAEGVAVIVVSSELEEVLGLSHRIVVMAGGRQRGTLDRDEATPERVMALAVAA